MEKKARKVTIDETTKTITIEGHKVYGYPATEKQKEYLVALGCTIVNNGGRNRWAKNISSIDASFAIQKIKENYAVTINVN